jgi:hypothetical protein
MIMVQMVCAKVIGKTYFRKNCFQKSATPPGGWQNCAKMPGIILRQLKNNDILDLPRVRSPNFSHLSNPKEDVRNKMPDFGL